MTNKGTIIVLSAVFTAVEVATVLLGAQVRDVPANNGDNDAFLDTASTSALTDEVGKIVAAAFTFTPATVPATDKAAHDALTGRATAQYESLYRPLLQQAQSKGLNVTTTVRAIGVTALNGDRAQLLVLADQAAKSTATGQSDLGPAHLDLIVERHDGHWKIASIEVL